MYVCMHASIQLPIDLFIYLSDGPIYPSIYLSIDYLPTHPISEKNKFHMGGNIFNTYPYISVHTSVKL